MNPEVIIRFHCENASKRCKTTFDVIQPLDKVSVRAAGVSIKNRGWKRTVDGLLFCDTCSAKLTLCPVCKTTSFRYGYNGTCSKECAARKDEVLIDDEARAIAEEARLTV